MREFDYSPFSSTVTRDDIAIYIRNHPKERRLLPAKRRLIWGCAAAAAVMVVASILSIYFGLIYLALLALVGFILALGLGMMAYDSDGYYTKQVRWQRFASANDLNYQSSLSQLPYEGVVFGSSSGFLTASNILTTKAGIKPAFETGQYTYSAPYGGRSRTYICQYLMIQLDKPLPHVLLESKAGGVGSGVAQTSNLPRRFELNQILNLEGNFSDYFTMYVPDDYGGDANYIFTPDLMEVLLDDTLGKFDMEIVGDKLFFYMKIDDAGGDEEVMRRLQGILEIITSKVIDRTARYNDTRPEYKSSGQPVSPPRLKVSHRLAWFYLAVVILYCLVVYLYYSFR